MPSTKSMRLLTHKEAAERLGLSRSALFRLVQSGQITHTRIGPHARKQIRFLEAHLEAWVDSQTVTATPVPRRETVSEEFDRAAMCKELGIELDHEFS